ncbi:hypothetical protein CJU90_4436 [Yarrowia sp. C11]|nr:hypothetical protein CKK34_6718 [Yarrowia sp. E02]KAG5365359.1 hypothetical protein CJU90_4436 [Yarrowia sp. C11]
MFKRITTKTVPSVSPVSRLTTIRHNSNTAWIQELVDKTEGKGYDVANAGMKSHKVAWGDHDSFNHVNNCVYLKWFETARVNMFNQVMGQHKGDEFKLFMTPKAIGPILRSGDLEWRYPVQFPDTVTVMHKVEPLDSPDRFILRGVVVSHNAKKVAARIKEIIVTVDYRKGGVKAPIPGGVRKALEKLAAKTTPKPARK